MTSEALKALAERVEGATGPDINIDYALAAEFGRPWVLPRYTASIDAALGLVERAWPHKPWFDIEGFNSRPDLAGVWEVAIDGTAEARAPTLPLAILSALLRALLAKGE